MQPHLPVIACLQVPLTWQRALRKADLEMVSPGAWWAPSPDISVGAHNSTYGVVTSVTHL